MSWPRANATPGRGAGSSARRCQGGLSHAHGPESLCDEMAKLGNEACSMTVTEAERFGEVVAVSIPFGRYEDIPVEGLRGKIVIDTMDYYRLRDGHIRELDDGTTTSSELFQRHAEGARVASRPSTRSARKSSPRGHGRRAPTALPCLSPAMTRRPSVSSRP